MSKPVTLLVGEEMNTSHWKENLQGTRDCHEVHTMIEAIEWLQGNSVHQVLVQENLPITTPERVNDPYPDEFQTVPAEGRGTALAAYIRDEQLIEQSTPLYLVVHDTEKYSSSPAGVTKVIDSMDAAREVRLARYAFPPQSERSGR